MNNNVYVIAEVDNVPETEYRDYLNPIKTRRYGRLLKRALVTAMKAIKISGIEHPDAIINVQLWDVLRTLRSYSLHYL